MKWKEQPKIEEIMQHIRKNPLSRSAKAYELAHASVSEKINFKELTRQIHAYSYKHSSNFFGLFRHSKNEALLADDITFNEAYDSAKKDSRTGQIRESMRI